MYLKFSCCGWSSVLYFHVCVCDFFLVRCILTEGLMFYGKCLLLYLNANTSYVQLLTKLIINHWTFHVFFFITVFVEVTYKVFILFSEFGMVLGCIKFCIEQWWEIKENIILRKPEYSSKVIRIQRSRLAKKSWCVTRDPRQIEKVAGIPGVITFYLHSVKNASKCKFPMPSAPPQTKCRLADPPPPTLTTATRHSK